MSISAFTAIFINPSPVSPSIMAKPATAKAVVIKKKRWVAIHAPKLFNEQVIGESFVGDPQELVGRNVTVSLMILTGDPQKQTTNVSFKITGAKENSVTTELIGYQIIPSAAKKLMRRSREKIEDSFIVETSDKKLIRVKPLIVTRGRTTGSVMASMQKLQRAYIAKMISKMDFENFVREVVQKKLQHGLAQLLRRLYPVGACEIRMLEFIPAEKVKELGLKVTLPPENLPELPKRVQKEEEKESATEEAPAEGEQSEAPAEEASADETA
jgi:small subunit ribosomal protein S3Ae